MKNLYLSLKNSVSTLVLIWVLLSIASPSQAQVYYTLSDANFNTSGDQLRRVGLNGSGDAQVATGFVTTPGPVAIDPANNQAFVAQTPTAAPAILKVNLISGASTTLLSFATGVSPSGLAVDRTNGFLYYSVGDGNFATTGDQLRRIKLDGTGDEQIATGFAEVIGNVALDLANNRVFVLDTRTGSGISSQIFAVDLTTKVATEFKNSTLAIRGLDVDRANSTLYYLVDDGAFGTTNDELRKINLDGSGDALVATGFVNAPGPIVVDPVNNRVLVADLRANIPRIHAVTITNPVATVFFTPPGTGFTLTGIALFQQNPVVTTDAASTITSTAAVLGGNVTAAGSSSVTERGVVYSPTSTTPAIGSGTKVQIGTGTGTFSQTVSGLTGSTTYYVRAYAINAAGTSYGAVQSFVTPAPNAAPTDIALTATSVAENQASGTVVGILSTTDANTGQTFSYSLVTGAGSTDNASFQIVGSQLRTAAVFDFETKSSYLIRIRTTDNGSPALSFEESFTITVTNVNETPTISPQTFAVNENAANGTVVGTVVASDPDAGATLSYSILSGNTSGAFTLVGNSLQVANSAALDFETTPTFSLSVRVSDGTLSATALVTVNLNNIAESGLSISPVTPAAVCAGSPLNLTATATGFTPTNYTWSSTPAGFAASGASLTAFTQNAPAVGVPTTYTVTASATDGTTTAGASVTVLVNPTPTLTVVGAGANPTTCGASDGSITFTSTNLPNGVYSLTYTGSGSPKPVMVANNGFLLTGLAAGTYSNLSISNSGCIGSVTASRTLSDPAQPIASVGGSQAICSGSTATLSATAANGTGVWSVLSGPSTASSQFDNTASPTAVFTPAGGAGTYTLRWTVSNGACTPAIGDVVITITALPTLAAGAGTNPSTCATATGSIAFTSTNLPDGTYSLTYTGAGSPKNVTVSGNAFSLTGLAAGSYSNFSISNNGCVGSVATTLTLNDPPTPTLTMGTRTNPSACGASTGSIAFTSTNLPDGTYALTYTGAGGPKNVVVSSNAFSLMGLAAGTYSNFSITSSGCVGSVATSVTLSDPVASTVSLTNSGPLSCINTSVTLTATAGLSSYTFSSEASQAGGAAGNTATVTNAGSYSVTATDANGCTGMASTSVGSNTSLATPTLLTQAGQSAVTVDLNSGNVILLASGCAGTIQWTGSNNTSGSGTTISVPTTQPGTLVYQARCLLGTCISAPASATVTVGVRLQVLHRDVDNYADNNSVQPVLIVANQGGGALPLSAITLRYYLTVENFMPMTNVRVLSAQVGAQNVQSRYVPLEQPRQGALGYVEYSFTAGAGQLAAGKDSGPVQGYIAKSDYGGLNELDDYSYASVRDKLLANPRITAYYNGVLAWGQEPALVTPRRQLRVLTESKNGPSATAITTNLLLRNEGNLPVDFSQLRIRYYFTGDNQQGLTFFSDFRYQGQGALQGQLVRINPPLANADTYLEITPTFSGQLMPLSSLGVIRYSIYSPQGARLNQTNDYSYQDRPEEFSPNSRIVVYVGSERVWGQEPGASARIASAESATEFTVRVLGNPINDNQVRIEVAGAQDQPLRLQLTDLTGRVVSERLIDRAGAVERQQLPIGQQPAGVLLLQVSTPTQSQTLKVLNP